LAIASHHITAAQLRLLLKPPVPAIAAGTGTLVAAWLEWSQAPAALLCPWIAAGLTLMGARLLLGRRAHQVDVVDRITSISSNLGDAEETARSPLGKAHLRLVQPPNAFRIKDSDGTVVLRSWERHSNAQGPEGEKRPAAIADDAP